VLCEGASASYTILADENATEYNWQTTATTILENDNTIEIVAGMQDFFISVQSANDCGVSNYAALTVSVPDGNTSPANFNGDCVVNDDDLQMLLNQYGCLNDCSSFDLNNDGYIGVNDVLLFILFSAQ
jgi:hypothetical protein